MFPAPITHTRPMRMNRRSRTAPQGLPPSNRALTGSGFTLGRSRLFPFDSDALPAHDRSIGRAGTDRHVKTREDVTWI
jgi:hypothetical protein